MSNDFKLGLENLKTVEFHLGTLKMSKSCFYVFL